jgi:uncharacterized membrane protein|tara:strand:+ start:82 stop:471 length:390 start_codon:yes stop_codon:yes gene_type:complete
MLEFHFRDVLQVMIGATILAIPVGFTQETWELGKQLPMWSIFVLLAISVSFIGSFVYYNFFRHIGLKNQLKNFIKRTASIYVVSFLVVAGLLMTIQKAPWSTDALLAFKRTVIVALPASMSAAVADIVK